MVADNAGGNLLVLGICTMRSLVIGTCVSFFACSHLLAEETSFGLTLEEINGKVDGFGVVWALEVTGIAPNTAASGTDLQIGDIIIEVARFAPTIDSTGSQSGMIELLNAAAYNDQYRLRVVRPGGNPVSEPLAMNARVGLQVDVADFSYPKGREIYALVYTGAFEDALAGLRDSDSDRRRGTVRYFRAMMFIYHNVYSDVCPVAQPFVEITEQNMKRYSDPDLNALYGYEGATDTRRIREKYFRDYARAKSTVGLSDVLFGGQFLVDVGNEVIHIIRENGCGSDALEQFEENLQIAFSRANPV